MEKTFIISLLFNCIFSVSAFSQIKFAEVPELQKKEILYDSLTNVEPLNNVPFYEKFKHLVGQKIIPICPSFSIDISRNKYMLTSLSLSFDEILNKTLMIDSISYFCGYNFYIHDVNNAQNTLCFRVLEGEYEIKDFNLNFICLGYYEKIKQMFLGKELTYVHKDTEYDTHKFGATNDRFIDYNTKENLEKLIPQNTIWKCTDVLVLPGSTDVNRYYDNRVVVNVENEQYGKYYILASKLLKNNSERKFLLKEDFDKKQTIERQQKAKAQKEKEDYARYAAELEKRKKERRSTILNKYGKYYGNLILQNKVVVGMSKQQCKEALGNPTRVNTTTTVSRVSEQWVYDFDKKYLYFENGILVAIQDRE